VPRDIKELIRDIVIRCERIIRFSADVGKEEFLQEEWNVDAALYNLIVIGEAVKNLPDYFRTKHGDRIPFRSIAGTRDFYAHEYFRLNYDTIWDTLTGEVPELLKELKKMREELDE
jgi:uncharacterized protein with HEPN domain